MPVSVVNTCLSSSNCTSVNLSFPKLKWVSQHSLYHLCPRNPLFFSAHSVLFFRSVFVHLSGMVSSLHLRILVPREKEDLPSTWLSWTSSANSPPSLWDKTRGLCKFFLLSWRVGGFSVTGVCDNWCNWCFLCVSAWCEASSWNVHLVLCVKFFLCMHGCMSLFILSVWPPASP